MRILHTADWHLGHRLHGFDRGHEHGEFLRWLADLLVEHRVDLLLVAGDLFDSANPPASAQAAWYRFLAALSRRAPDLRVVVVAGNHDSPSRLAAPAPVLEGLGVTVMGTVTARQGGLDPDPVVEVRTPRGDGVALAAIPHLRRSDLPRVGDDRDPLAEGVAGIYREALERARGLGLPTVATGHLYVVGGQVSELSERVILGGNLHAVPLGSFEGWDYVALGHLHKGQELGTGRWYSGSPIPLSLPERAYRHQVLMVDLGAGGLERVEAIPVPRWVELLRIPTEGSLPLDEALDALAGLDPGGGPRPFLEVCVTLDRPEPGLKAMVDQALQDKEVNLARIQVHYTGRGGQPEARETRLDELGPWEVFQARWDRDHDGPVPRDLADAFHEALDMAQEGEP